MPSTARFESSNTASNRRTGDPVTHADPDQAAHSTHDIEPGDELLLHDLHPTTGDMRGDILDGLMSSPKTLPCKYFYDERGSALFDEICELEEYYPTRTETAILVKHAPDMASRLGENALVIELGSGNSTKTPLLLGALRQAAGYVPIDISKEHLMSAARRIRATFPQLAIRPVCADFTAPLDLPDFGFAAGPRYVFFPGSTMGNFAPAGQRKLLHQIVSLCGPGDGGLLIGLDLLKDRETLEAAYNDRRGVTAAFNLNLLERVNRELGGTFSVEAFEHQAPFNADEERIEMHLVSRSDQTARIGEDTVQFDAGERICTEHSYKFSVDAFTLLASEVGLHQRAVWTDEDDLFAVILFETGSGSEA